MDELSLAVLALILAVLLGLGIVERLLHERNLRTFSIRVHVNGTRGKSSVTRLIAAGLRAGGVRTCAKTTGTLPRLIHPDGVEEPIYRVGRPNVIEQVGVVRRARRLEAKAIVIECMALQPFLQWVSTSALIRPTHGVVTNIRADHLDVMGPDEHGVGAALAGSVPFSAPTYTSEHRYLDELSEACAARHSELIVVGEADEGVTDDELEAFRYIEHRENVALALRVCRDLGIARRTALAGMQAARPDPGALTVEKRMSFGRRLCFVNGFAANDPESTGQVWEIALGRNQEFTRKVALVNCRVDRPERSVQLGEACVRWTPADHYVVTGTGTTFFVHAAERAGLARSRLQVLEGARAPALAESLAGLADPEGLVVGLGNIGGVGLELMDFLRSQERFV